MDYLKPLPKKEKEEDENKDNKEETKDFDIEHFLLNYYCLK